MQWYIDFIQMVANCLGTYPFLAPTVLGLIGSPIMACFPGLKWWQRPIAFVLTPIVGTVVFYLAELVVGLGVVVFLGIGIFSAIHTVSWLLPKAIFTGDWGSPQPE